MDKLLLDALSNLSVALEEISKALASKKEPTSGTAKAVQGGDFVKQISEIHIGVKSLQKDTKKILSNQQTIMSMAKQKPDKTDVASKLGEDKSKIKMIKEGLGVIVLMAVAILALGMAFKIVGKVDFLSVIAISTAILLLSIAFANVTKVLKKSGFTVKDGINFVLAVVSISLGVMLSSMILSKVRPIGIAQFFTTLFIAGAFAVIAYGMSGFLKAFKGMDPATLLKSVIFLPLILPAIALGIALASYALQLVKPIGIAQFFTTLFIAAAFTVIAFGMNQMLNAFKGKSMADITKAAIFLPLMLPAIALGIALASYAFQLVKPIPFMTLLNILAMGLVLGVIAIAMVIPIRILGKMNPKDMLMGGLGIVVVAGAIMVSSLLLNLGTYKNHPGFGWAVGVGLSILAFTPAVVVLGMIAMSGIGALAILAGGAMVLVVAATIVGASFILSTGKYDKGPSTGWAAGTGIVMTVFGLSMLTLGTFILATFGLGWLALQAGSAAVLMISQTIVDSASILRKGNFTGGPTKKWAEGVSLAIGAFSPVYSMLMTSGVMKIFGIGGVSPSDFSNAIRVISKGIVDAGTYFRGMGGFTGGPTKQWAEGVGTAIGAFAPVYDVLMKNTGWLASGVSPADMVSAIMTISQGIVAAANYFGKNVAVFDLSKVPSKKWGENVGAAIGAFAPIFTQMSKDSGFFTSGDAVMLQMRNAIILISDAIITVGRLFAKVPAGVWSKPGPSESWSTGVKTAVTSFADMYKSLDEAGVTGMSGGLIPITTIINMSKAIAVVSILLSRGNYTKSIPPNWMKGVTSTIMQYVSLTRWINTMSGGPLGGILSAFGMYNPIDHAVRGLVKLSKAYGTLADSLGKFGNVIQSMDVEKINMFRSLTGNMAILSTLDSEMFDKMMDVLEKRSGVFADLASQYNKEQSKSSSAPGPSAGGVSTAPKKTDGQVLGEKLDRIAASLADIQTVVGSGGSLKSYIDGLGKEPTIGSNNNAPQYR